MTWHSTSNLFIKRLNQKGLSSQVLAGLLCHEAERLYPGLFEAVSVRQGCLHVAVEPSKAIGFKLIEGKLLKEINQYAENQNLPLLTSFRLTYSN